MICDAKMSRTELMLIIDVLESDLELHDRSLSQIVSKVFFVLVKDGILYNITLFHRMVLKRASSSSNLIGRSATKNHSFCKKGDSCNDPTRCNEGKRKKKSNLNEVETYDKPAVRYSFCNVMGTRYPFLYSLFANLFNGKLPHEQKIRISGSRVLRTSFDYIMLVLQSFLSWNFAW